MSASWITLDHLAISDLIWPSSAAAVPASTEALPGIRLGDKPRHLHVQPPHDTAWSSGRRNQREPGGRLEAGQHRLRHGGQFGCRGGALGGGDRERTQRSRLHVADHGREVRENQVQLTAEKVIDRRCLSAIGNVHHLDAGLDRKKLTCHVWRGAEPA